MFLVKRDRRHGPALHPLSIHPSSYQLLLFVITLTAELPEATDCRHAVGRKGVDLLILALMRSTALARHIGDHLQPKRQTIVVDALRCKGGPDTVVA